MPLSKEKPLTVEELKAVIGEVLDQRQKEKDEQSTSSKEEKSSPNGGERTPKYVCTKGNCRFTTDDLDAYLDHRDDHKEKENPAEKEAPPAPAPAPERRRHDTVDEFLACPECRPRFDKRYMKDGWTPPKPEAEKKEEKPKKRSLF